MTFGFAESLPDQPDQRVAAFRRSFALFDAAVRGLAWKAVDRSDDASALTCVEVAADQPYILFGGFDLGLPAAATRDVAPIMFRPRFDDDGSV